MNNLGRNFLIGGLVGMAVGQMATAKEDPSMMRKARTTMKRAIRFFSNMKRMM